MDIRPTGQATDASDAAVAEMAVLGFDGLRTWTAKDPDPMEVPEGTSPDERQLLLSYARGKLRTSWLLGDRQVVAVHEVALDDPSLELFSLLSDGVIVITETVSARDRARLTILPPHHYELLVDAGPEALLPAHRAHVARTIARSGAKPCLLGPDDYGTVASFRSRTNEKRVRRAALVAVGISLGMPAAILLAAASAWCGGFLDTAGLAFASVAGLLWLGRSLTSASELPALISRVDRWIPPVRPGAATVLGRPPDLG